MRPAVSPSTWPPGSLTARDGSRARRWASTVRHCGHEHVDAAAPEGSNGISGASTDLETRTCATRAHAPLPRGQGVVYSTNAVTSASLSLTGLVSTDTA